MSGAEPALATREPTLSRLLGRYDAGRPGPAIVIVAGVHGNEPAGVEAARAVVGTLERHALPLRGTVTAVAGNLAALRAGRRFVSRDLNRVWSREQIQWLRDGESPFDDAEQAEHRDLLDVFDRVLSDRAGPDRVIVLDLHSTSAPSAPFHSISDTLHSRRIALAVPVPLVLGLEEAVRGTLLDFMEDEGCPLILIEGGQHDDPQTVRHHEAAVWQILVTVGALPAADVPGFAEHRAGLVAAARGLPHVVEVTYRHPIGENDRFVMRPGFVNFQRVKRGDALADDARGPVTAPESGLLLMPLYQVQGDDGFFIARPVRKSWLKVSTLARWLRVDRWLPHLPGVTRDPAWRERLLVDPQIARWFTVQLFHLCGYRRLPPRGGKLVFTRRVEG